MFYVFGSQRDSPCHLHLIKAVNVHTLAELFAIPLQFHGTPLLQSITSLDTVCIHENGRIRGCLRGAHLLPLSNGSKVLRVAQPGRMPLGLGNTMRQLLYAIRPRQGSSRLWRKPQPIWRFDGVSAYASQISLNLDDGNIRAFQFLLQGVSDIPQDMLEDPLLCGSLLISLISRL
jgi:hypothetical protein